MMVQGRSAETNAPGSRRFNAAIKIAREPASACRVVVQVAFSGRELAMPAKSAAQQKAAGAALAAKRGDIPQSKLKGASRQMETSMSETQLEELAHAKRKGKPEHVGK